MKLKSISKYAGTPAKIFTTALILSIVVLILQGIIIQIGFMLLYKESSRQQSEYEKPAWRVSRSTKRFLPDGTIHLVHRTNEYRGAGQDYRLEKIYDVNDNLLWEGIHKDVPYEYLVRAEGLVRGFGDRDFRAMQTITPGFSRALEIPVNFQNKTGEVWRYEPGDDLFVGYKIGSGKIGYIGSSGFKDSKSQAKPFGKFKQFSAWTPQDSLSPTLFWQTEHRIYEINFEKQQVDVIFESLEAKITLVRALRWKPSERPVSSGIEYRPMLHCLTEDDKHHLIMREPDQKLAVTVPDDLHSGSVRFTATKEQVFLYYSGADQKPPEYTSSPKDWKERFNQYRSKPHKMWVELYGMDDEGDFDLINRFDWVRPAYPLAKKGDPWQRVKSYVVKVSPPAYDWAWHLGGMKTWLYLHNRDSLTHNFAQLIGEFLPASSILNYLLSAAMMGFAFWHGWSRRTSLLRFLLWIAFVGAFNLAGLLTYLALNHTAVIKCPACGQRRGLGQVDCVRCSEPLPAPEQRKLDLIFSA